MSAAAEEHGLLSDAPVIKPVEFPVQAKLITEFIGTYFLTLVVICTVIRISTSKHYFDRVVVAVRR